MTTGERPRMRTDARSKNKGKTEWKKPKWQVHKRSHCPKRMWFKSKWKRSRPLKTRNCWIELSCWKWASPKSWMLWKKQQMESFTTPRGNIERSMTWSYSRRTQKTLILCWKLSNSFAESSLRSFQHTESEKMQQAPSLTMKPVPRKEWSSPKRLVNFEITKASCSNHTRSTWKFWNSYRR